MGKTMLTTRIEVQDAECVLPKDQVFSVTREKLVQESGRASIYVVFQVTLTDCWEVFAALREGIVPRTCYTMSADGCYESLCMRK